MRITRVLIALLPALSIVTATLLASTAVGPAGLAGSVPFPPFVAIHYLLRQPASRARVACIRMRPRTRCPHEWTARLLVADLSRRLRVCPPAGELGQHTAVGRAILCVMALAVIGLAEWMLSSLYFWETADWRPSPAVIWAALSYPLISVALRPLDVDRPRRNNAASNAELESDV